MQRSIIIIAVLFSITLGHSQIMPYSRPLQYNGGFAGINDDWRFNTDAYFGNIFFQNSVSVDVLSNKLGGGIGLFIQNTLNNYQNTHCVGLAYSPKFLINENWGIAPSVTIRQFNNRYNYPEFIYPYSDGSVRNFLPDGGRLYTGNYAPDKFEFRSTINPNISNPGIGVDLGILLNSPNGFIGYKISRNYGLFWSQFYHSVQFGKAFNKITSIEQGWLVSGSIDFHNIKPSLRKSINDTVAVGFHDGLETIRYEIENNEMALSERQYRSNITINALRRSKGWRYGLGVIFILSNRSYTFMPHSSLILGYVFKKFTVKNALIIYSELGAIDTVTNQFSIEYRFERDLNKLNKRRIKKMKYNL